MWFFHVWICHIWIIHVWILPMWRDGETPDLRSKRHFPTREYWNMESPSKAPYSERNCRKSTFILTVNCLIHPPIRGKENRPPHKPINSAIGTGGLDFLIAYALMILCHSLFEVVVYFDCPRFPVCFSPSWRCAGSSASSSRFLCGYGLPSFRQDHHASCLRFWHKL